MLLGLKIRCGNSLLSLRYYGNRAYIAVVRSINLPDIVYVVCFILWFLMCNGVNTKSYFYSIWYARKLRSITVYNGFWKSSVLLSCFILNPCVFHFRFWLPGHLWSVKSKSSAVFVTRKINNIVYSPVIRRFTVGCLEIFFHSQDYRRME